MKRSTDRILTSHTGLLTCCTRARAHARIAP